jgi:hypothetical protein
MQACYWIRRRVRPTPPSRDRPVLAHLLLFLARLSFIFAGSSASLIIFVRSADTRFSVVGIAILLAAVFAQFCYARELEVLSGVLDQR